MLPDGQRQFANRDLLDNRRIWMDLFHSNNINFLIIVLGYAMGLGFIRTFFEFEIPYCDRNDYHFTITSDYCIENFFLGIFDREVLNQLYDQKITTLPGLYMVSAMLLGPFGACSEYYLRFVNLIAASINFVLFYLISKNTYDIDFEWRNVLTAFNMGMLPPLYFFSHVYYTDVFSVTFVMLMQTCFIYNMHPMVIIFGFCAVMMRQTNVVFIAMFGGMYFLKEFIYVVKVNIKNISGDNTLQPNRELTWDDIVDIYENFRIRIAVIKNMRSIVWWHLTWYTMSLLSFVFFVYVNGSIVLGDKNAHQAGLHLPQILYFGLFFTIFGGPHIIERYFIFYDFIIRKYIRAALLFIIFSLIVYLNTKEHPYLLADNRHFTFYIWQRFYQRYEMFRYAMIPIYSCGLYILYRRLRADNDLIFITFYIPATVAILCFQDMIEIRYFLIPFLLARLHFRNVSAYALALEFIGYLVINFATFQVFFEKEIKWDEYDIAQRMMW